MIPSRHASQLPCRAEVGRTCQLLMPALETRGVLPLARCFRTRHQLHALRSTAAKWRRCRDDRGVPQRERQRASGIRRCMMLKSIFLSDIWAATDSWLMLPMLPLLPPAAASQLLTSAAACRGGRCSKRLTVRLIGMQLLSMVGAAGAWPIVQYGNPSNSVVRDTRRVRFISC